MFMKKRICVLLITLALLFVPGVCALAGNTLWRIDSENNTVYILGSIHCLKSSDYPLSPVVEKAFTDSQVLVFEADLEEGSGPKMQQLLLQKGMLSEGSLRTLLGEKTWQLASKRMEKTGVPIQTFAMFKPWLFAMTLVAMELQKLGYDPKYGVDHHFYFKAKDEGKPVIALESAEFQIDLLAQMKQKQQVEFVRQTLKELDVIEKEVTKMVEVWKKGDLNSLEEMILESFKEFPELKKTLLLNRNRTWVEKIENFLNGDKTYLVVVGSAHLAGKDSVVDLLEKKGYSLKNL